MEISVSVASGVVEGLTLKIYVPSAQHLVSGGIASHQLDESLPLKTVSARKGDSEMSRTLRTNTNILPLATRMAR